MIKRIAAFILSAALGLSTALPLIGTRMECGPGMGPSAMTGSALSGDASCNSVSACPERPATSALMAGSCCRIAPIDESNALRATLGDHRTPSPDEGRGLLVAALPIAAAPYAASLAAMRPAGGSPPTASPPSPTRTTILRN